MQHRASLLFLALSLLGPPACTSASGGHGDDDDDLTIDTGDGDADADADGDGDNDGDGSCGGACGNVADICAGSDEQLCLEDCNRFGEFSSGACADALSDYNACVAGAQTCDATNGVAGCDAESQAAGTACANGCYDLVDCLNACDAADEPCQQACVDNADPAGGRALQTLLTCWTGACGAPPAADAEQAAKDAFSQCLDDSCLDEQAQCR